LFDKFHRAASEPQRTGPDQQQPAGVTIVTCGDYLYAEAGRAAAVLRDAVGLPVSVLPLDELTVLYRPDSAAVEYRLRLRAEVGAGKVILLSSGYPDVLVTLWAEAVGRAPDITRGYVSQPNCTAASSLLAAGCTWMQIAGLVLSLSEQEQEHEAEVVALARKLRGLEDQLRADLRGAWDDPAWYADATALLNATPSLDS
jgi:phosphoketolase